MSAEVLGKITFLETPDVNGSSLVLTLSGTANQILTSQSAEVGTISIASNPIIPGTAGLRLPVGTTAQRSGSPSSGDTRFNTDLDALELYTGSAWVQDVGVLDKSVTDVSLTTAAGGNLVSFSVPGNTLGTSRILRITAEGTFTYTSGSQRGITVGVTYGGATMWLDTTPNITSTSSFGWSMTFHLIANGATNAQKLTGKVFFGQSGAPTSGTVGELSANTQISETALYGTSGVDSTTAQTLNVTFAMSAAVTTVAMVKRVHVIELL